MEELGLVMHCILVNVQTDNVSTGKVSVDYINGFPQPMKGKANEKT